ncbi:hypothetical protein OAM69_03245 [bacterium]|nr:hypothetical protein [bacterium]
MRLGILGYDDGHPGRRAISLWNATPYSIDKAHDHAGSQVFNAQRGLVASPE